jgi:hypothetical protein
MEKIIAQEFIEGEDRLGDAYKKLRDSEHLDQLEILHYHPGYITPEEFFHRMFMSVHRIKRAQKNLTVLFNSVDQLSARFPLCAKQEIFIPGIIESLSGEGITSIFITVDEPGQPAEQYGLLPMADLILSFYPYRFTLGSYFGHLKEAARRYNREEQFSQNIEKNEFRNLDRDSLREEIVLEVVRFAGGQRAGAKGLLELVDKPEISPHDKAGLHFTELSPKHPLGESLRYRQHIIN